MRVAQKSVLVVDDERAVRELLQALLKRLGHSVQTAASGPEALRKLDGGDFDVVITDFLMPEMNGNQLAREIRRRRPTIPIVLITGYQPEAVVAEISCVIGKPFSPAELRQTLAALP